MTTGVVKLRHRMSCPKGNVRAVKTSKMIHGWFIGNGVRPIVPIFFSAAMWLNIAKLLKHHLLIKLE